MPSFVVPAKDRAGGLWVMWSDEMQLSIVFASQNLVLATVVNGTTKFAFNLACVYGDPHHRRTRDIWCKIESFVVSSPGNPLYCMGDLNNIMFPCEKSNPSKGNLHVPCEKMWINGYGL